MSQTIKGCVTRNAGSSGRVAICLGRSQTLRDLLSDRCVTLLMPFATPPSAAANRKRVRPRYATPQRGHTTSFFVFSEWSRLLNLPPQFTHIMRRRICD